MQFPQSSVWETAYFTFESHGFKNVFTFAWTLMGKLLPILLLSIWAITSRDNWWPIIIVPITMYVFQLINVISFDTSKFDEIEWINTLPIAIIIFIILYCIRKITIKYLILLDIGERISEAKKVAKSILKS